MQSATGFGCSVIHHRIETNISLEDLLGNLSLSSEELMSLGAIYLNQERLFKNPCLKPGDVLRIHSRPKRYPVQDFNWLQRIFAQNENWILIHKPAGIPTHPTLDNQIENVLAQLENVLRIKLYVTTRLDVPTEGLLLLAKNKTTQSQLNDLFAQGLVRKIYQAESRSGLAPLGLHQHWMFTADRSPKKLTSFPEPLTKECCLEILSREPRDNFFHYKILLLTGRTHQIRAQMAYLQSPIRGDQLYGDSEVLQPGLDQIALIAKELHFSSEVSKELDLASRSFCLS